MISYRTTTDDIAPDMLTGFFVDWPNPPSPTTHLRLLESSSHRVVAVDEETGYAVGFANAICDGVLSAYIPLLEVLPEYQGRGIGREIMRRMLQQLDDYYMVDLLCDPDREKFYRPLGMQPATGMLIRRYEKQRGRADVEGEISDVGFQISDEQGRTVGDTIVEMEERKGRVMERSNVSSGAEWEDRVGYSRAVRVGPFISVAGTVAVDSEGEIVGEDDPYAQTRHILGVIGKSLEAAGASLTDVVRTRIFVSDIERWEEVAHAHNEAFANIRPACTMVEVSRLINTRMMVEIEADAIVGY